MKGYLDEGVLVEELDKAMAALKAAPATANDGFRNWVLEAAVPLELLLEVLKDYNGEPDKCEEEGPKSKTSKVVPHHPMSSLTIPVNRSRNLSLH